MRILITGMNKLQCTEDFYKFQQLKVVPSHYSLLRCLRDMGHTVDQRVVKIGETLDEYDRVICFLHNAGSFVQSVYNVGWTLFQRPDAILAYDDWQIESIYNSLYFSNERCEEDLFRDHLKNQHVQLEGFNEVSKKFILKGLSRIRKEKLPVLISAFSGGDVSKLTNLENVHTYNPNPYHLHRQTMRVHPEDKDRTFNFASLVQGKTQKWLKKQNCPWPIEYFGSKKDNQERITEDVMVAVYAHHWGCLMPGYYHAGSGWWRARPTQVADVGSILIGEPAEMKIYYGDESLASLTAADLKDCSTHELTVIAEAQRHALYTLHPLDKSVQQRELQVVLDL